MSEPTVGSEQSLLDVLAGESLDAGDLGPADDVALAARAGLVLAHEARLLDEGRLSEWLELLDEDFVYWVPADPVAADPRASVSIALDDRRRIEDRVTWILGGDSYAHQPAWVTRRVLGNVEAWALPADLVLVRSTFTIHARRREETFVIGGWYEHRLRFTGEGARLLRKRVHTVDADLHRRNFTFVL